MYARSLPFQIGAKILSMKSWLTSMFSRQKKKEVSDIKSLLIEKHFSHQQSHQRGRLKFSLKSGKIFSRNSQFNDYAQHEAIRLPEMKLFEANKFLWKLFTSDEHISSFLFFDNTIEFLKSHLFGNICKENCARRQVSLNTNLMRVVTLFST